MPEAKDKNVISIREYLDFRLSALEERLNKNESKSEERDGEITDSLQRMADAIVSKDTIDRLRLTLIGKIDEIKNNIVDIATDQKAYDKRITKLEHQATLERWVARSAWTVILAAIVAKVTGWI